MGIRSTYRKVILLVVGLLAVTTMSALPPAFADPHVGGDGGGSSGNPGTGPVDSTPPGVKLVFRCLNSVDGAMYDVRNNPPTRWTYAHYPICEGNTPGTDGNGSCPSGALVYRFYSTGPDMAVSSPQAAKAYTVSRVNYPSWCADGVKFSVDLPNPIDAKGVTSSKSPWAASSSTNKYGQSVVRNEYGVIAPSVKIASSSNTCDALMTNSLHTMLTDPQYSAMVSDLKKRIFEEFYLATAYDSSTASAIKSLARGVALKYPRFALATANLKSGTRPKSANAMVFQNGSTDVKCDSSWDFATIIKVKASQVSGGNVTLTRAQLLQTRIVGACIVPLARYAYHYTYSSGSEAWGFRIGDGSERPSPAMTYVNSKQYIYPGSPGLYNSKLPAGQVALSAPFAAVHKGWRNTIASDVTSRARAGQVEPALQYSSSGTMLRSTKIPNANSSAEYATVGSQASKYAKCGYFPLPVEVITSLPGDSGSSTPTLHANVYLSSSSVLQARGDLGGVGSPNGTQDVASVTSMNASCNVACPGYGTSLSSLNYSLAMTGVNGYSTFTNDYRNIGQSVISSSYPTLAALKAKFYRPLQGSQKFQVKFTPTGATAQAIVPTRITPPCTLNIKSKPPTLKCPPSYIKNVTVQTTITRYDIYVNGVFSKSIAANSSATVDIPVINNIVAP